MVIINPELNSLHLLCNFVISKTCDQFINNEKNDQNDLCLIKYLNDGKFISVFLINFFFSFLLSSFFLLNEGLKSFPNELNLKFRFKLFVSYIISIFWKYFQTNDIDTLKTIVANLENEEIDKILHYDLLERFKIIICKKIHQLIKSGEINIENKHVEIFKNFYEKNEYYVEKNNDEEMSVYTNDLFYNDICDIIKEYIYSKNNSVMLHILKHYDFSNDKDENDLINNLTWLRKQRNISKFTPVANEPNDSSLNSSSIDRSHRQLKKKQRLDNNAETIQEKENDKREV